jgi:hypothetical protein
MVLPKATQSLSGGLRNLVRRVKSVKKKKRRRRRRRRMTPK